MMDYVVTCGAGFIGSHLTEALLARGNRVVVLDDLSTGKMDNLAAVLHDPRLEFVRGSITDRNLVREICRGVHGVFHQAAIASVPRSVEDPAQTNRVNVEGTLNVLIAARDAGVRSVVLASSCAVYGDQDTLPLREDGPVRPLTPYAVSKLAGEQYSCVVSHLYGLHTVCLRYFNVYGPRQDPASDYAAVIPRFITRILSRRSPTIYGDGLQTRDFIFVRDVVRANLIAAESAVPGVFNIAHGTRTSVNTLAEKIIGLVGIDTGIVHEEPRAGDIRDSLADVTRARTVLGFTPDNTLDDGLAETVAWFRSATPGPV